MNRLTSAGPPADTEFVVILPGRRARRDQSGAALVEFALILPVFMALALGLFSGGMAYNTKLSLNGAAREGARHGATLGVSTASCSGSTPMDRWLQCVADATIQAAGGDLDSGKTGRVVCAAYISDGTSSTDTQRSMTISSSGTSTSSSACFSDGQASSIRRVQVMVQRVEKIEAFFWSWNVTMTSRSITRFEATSS